MLVLSVCIDSALLPSLSSVFLALTVPGRTSHPDSKKQDPPLWRTHCIDQAGLRNAVNNYSSEPPPWACFNFFHPLFVFLFFFQCWGSNAGLHTCQFYHLTTPLFSSPLVYSEFRKSPKETVSGLKACTHSL